MTEPEDLEEDLFADLYDGDDNATKIEPSATEPISEPVQAIPQPTPETNLYEQKQEPDNSYSAIKNESMDGTGQDDDAEPTWNEEQGQDNGMNQYNGQMEEERRGIGIKEDG